MKTFVHIQPGSKILPLGPEGSWESEHLFPTVPVILDEEVRIYYGGGRMIDVPLEDRARLGSRTLKVLPGLATLRKDGFTSVGLREEGRGSLTTLPFQLEEPCRLQLNADCDEDRAIVVEVLELVAHAALQGFSSEAAVPFVENVRAVGARWRREDSLPVGVPVQLRFHFRGRRFVASAFTAIRSSVQPDDGTHSAACRPQQKLSVVRGPPPRFALRRAGSCQERHPSMSPPTSS